MKRPFNDQEKAILARIIDRFVNLCAGTPVQRTRISLGSNRVVLDRLVQEGYLKIARNEYLPTFKAFEEQDSNIRNVGRRLAGAVLSALKNLYRRHERNDFKLVEIMAEVQSVNLAVDVKEVIVGLVLATDFDFFSGYTGPRVIQARLSMHSVALKESILDFESVEEAWQRLIADRDVAHQRWLASQTSPTKVGGPLATQSTGGTFSFMRDPGLMQIAERDYSETLEIYNTRAWKARIVLAGGVLEAVLLDALQARESEARKNCRRSERSKPLGSWTLETLINVAVKLDMIKKDAERFTHSVRDYRNLIHPGKEMRAPLRVGESQAKIAEEVLKIVIEDLSKP